MPIVTLSEALLERTRCGQRQILRDRVLCGFCVVVGKRVISFAVATSCRGEQVRITLGRWPLLSVDQARAKALELLRDCRRGLKPTKTASAALPSVRAMLGAYVKAKALKASSHGRYESLLKTHFPQWFDVPIDAWSGRGFSEACQSFSSTRGAALVETGRGLIGALIKYANAVHGLKIQNPFHQLAAAGLLPPRAKPRARRLQEADLPQWFEAVSRIPDTQRDYLLFVLYTGLRRTEATNILREHCDLTTGVLRVPDTKTGRPHALPITPAMREILERRFAATADEKIFGGMSAEHVSSMAERAGAPRFMLHDLRKMFATVGEKIGVRETVLRGLLNHVAKKSDTLNRHYVQLTVGDLGVDLQRVQNELQRIAQA
ncbi:conserved hypothetical protein [Limnobacter sp. 130]|uniref:tyrosine-type recombinase/integrase n=1 Tax=Limnobacter sp. 130 TaxID=2653147 RepID=UPI0012F31D61|nr:tyrosine-type recombinase/integrase [Limnobacter sp. 130]VWX32814.1 conserved hypothetical protein [Limnobacter sp. 130]